MLYATVDAGGTIALEAMIASLDGHVLVRQGRSGDDAEALGAELAQSMLSAGAGRGSGYPVRRCDRRHPRRRGTTATVTSVTTHRVRR